MIPLYALQYLKNDFMLTILKLLECYEGVEKKREDLYLINNQVKWLRGRQAYQLCQRKTIWQSNDLGISNGTI
jgi:hypothetical protein